MWAAMKRTERSLHKTYMIMWIVSLQRSRDEETLRSLSWCRSMISSRRCSGMAAQDGSGFVVRVVEEEGRRISWWVGLVGWARYQIEVHSVCNKLIYH